MFFWSLFSSYRKPLLFLVFFSSKKCVPGSEQYVLLLPPSPSQSGLLHLASLEVVRRASGSSQRPLSDYLLPTLSNGHNYSRTQAHDRRANLKQTCSSGV